MRRARIYKLGPRTIIGTITHTRYIDRFGGLMFSPNDAQVKYLYMDEVDAYGADIVRTCQFLSRHGKPPAESDFQEMHEWFQRIWTIMLVTHAHCV